MVLDSLRTDKEFRKVRTHGVVVRNSLFTLRMADYRPRYGEAWQPRAVVGIVVSKKTLKSAVARNRVRRRLKEALRTLPELSACRAILFPNPQVLHVPFTELQDSLRQALAQAAKAPKRKKSNRKPKKPVTQGHPPKNSNQKAANHVSRSKDQT